MRKVLLASAALLLVGATSAFAADSATVTVSTTLAEWCELGDLSDIELSGNDLGDSGTSNFDITCNFEGAGNAPLTVTLSSLNGGVKSGDNIVDYTIAFETGSASASSTLTTALEVESTVTDPNVPEPKSFTATLLANVEIAGEYEDTVTVAVAP